MREFFKRNCLGLQQFLPLTLYMVIGQPEVVRTYILGTETLDWGAWCEAGTLCSQDIPPEFLFTTCECGTSLFCICVPPTSLDECGLFNFIVVRLPFNLISDSS